MGKIIPSLKKSFPLFEVIIKKKGFTLLIGVYFYYFKHNKLMGFHLREKCLINCLLGFFSNFLNRYNSLNAFPDLIIFFNSYQNTIFLKELRRLGIPVIGFINSKVLIGILEYPLFCNDQSYFTSFLFLKIYSKLIISNKG
jgi:ribosomal protein S2